MPRNSKNYQCQDKKEKKKKKSSILSTKIYQSINDYLIHSLKESKLRESFRKSNWVTKENQIFVGRRKERM